MLNCVECLSEVNGCDAKWLVPLGGSLSELPEREQVICRVWSWLWTFEEELAEELVQHGDRTDGSEVGWRRWPSALVYDIDRRVPPIRWWSFDWFDDFVAQSQ